MVDDPRRWTLYETEQVAPHIDRAALRGNIIDLIIELFILKSKHVCTVGSNFTQCNMNGKLIERGIYLLS